MDSHFDACIVWHSTMHVKRRIDPDFDYCTMFYLQYSGKEKVFFPNKIKFIQQIFVYTIRGDTSCEATSVLNLNWIKMLNVF